MCGNIETFIERTKQRNIRSLHKIVYFQKTKKKHAFLVGFRLISSSIADFIILLESYT